LVVTPKRICVAFYAALTILTASGKLLIPASTLSSDHSTDTQSTTTRLDIKVRPPLPPALVNGDWERALHMGVFQFRVSVGVGFWSMMMTILKSLTIVAALIAGGTSLAMAQNGPATR
jgi:hypothetical protein